ncbi:MAG TPA: hypothetical protein VIV54_12835 [Burkholderiales bacterium]
MHVDSLWIAGGLYGNPFALNALLSAHERERGAKALVFNGDFHWFDIDPHDFELVNEVALAHGATRGNVETELAAPHAGAGCGCAYPEWVDGATVERSNRILERLRSTATSVRGALSQLATLPMHLVAQVGDARVAIVHGDADSLAGWAFSQEALATAGGLRDAERALLETGADVVASSHTCLPVLQRFSSGCVLVNNGAAGMPNFRGELYGLATRIALTPANESIYGVRRGALFVDAVPLRYDTRAWEKRFLEQWPAGSDAHASYWERIRNGPAHSRQSALRREVSTLTPN